MVPGNTIRRLDVYNVDPVRELSSISLDFLPFLDRIQLVDLVDGVARMASAAVTACSTVPADEEDLIDAGPPQVFIIILGLDLVPQTPDVV